MDKRKKELRERPKSDRIKSPHPNPPKEGQSLMNNITQNMKFRQSLMKYAEKHGVSQASRKYNKGRSYIYFWLKQWDGSIESVAEQSHRPHHHEQMTYPGERVQTDVKAVPKKCIANPEMKLYHSYFFFGMLIWMRLKEYF